MKAFAAERGVSLTQSLSLQIQDSWFSTLLCSDVERDGMFLELIAGREATGAPIAEYLSSDAAHPLTLTVYVSPIAEEVLQWFEREARRRLPPAIVENSAS